MNSSGNYSSFAPPCTCPDGASEAASAAAWENPPPTRTMTSYSPSAGSWGPGTGAGGGWGPTAAGAGVPTLSQTRILPTRTNGGGIQRGDLPPTPLTPGVGLTRSMTNGGATREIGLSNYQTPPPFFRESRFSTHSEEDGGSSSAFAPPPVRRTATEHHGLRWAEAAEPDLEAQKERMRVSLHQLLYTLQTEIERPRPGAARSHDEMAAEDIRYNELDEQIEGVLRLLTALN
jgi:hypothetical protein